MLVTPVALAGAFAVPAIPAVPAVPPTTDAVAAAPFQGAPAQLGAGTTSLPAADPVGGPAVPLDRLRGITLLDRLDSMPRGDVQRFLDAHPDAVTGMLAAPPRASEVATWWAGAPQSGRGMLRELAPQLVGNLEGVPYGTRDLANRSVLGAAAQDLDRRLGGFVGRAERAELDARRHMLAEVERALTESGEPRSLVSLDVDGGGRAVVVVGDLATADYVDFLIPGMFFGVDAQIAAWTTTAHTLVADQQERLRAQGSTATVAAVAWIGYTTPSLLNVASMELAREGRDALTASLQGLRAARGDDQPHVAVLAHSYGSTAALLALAEEDVWVDALALVGSPGSPARSAEELHVADGNVWVGAAEWDPIPASGVFGSQPLARSYGARLFSVEEGTDPLTGAHLGGAVSHNDYFAPGSMSLRNLALIGLGEGGLVTGPGHDRDDFVRSLTRIR